MHKNFYLVLILLTLNFGLGLFFFKYLISYCWSPYKSGKNKKNKISWNLSKKKEKTILTKNKWWTTSFCFLGIFFAKIPSWIICKFDKWPLNSNWRSPGTIGNGLTDYISKKSKNANQKLITSDLATNKRQIYCTNSAVWQ